MTDPYQHQYGQQPMQQPVWSQQPVQQAPQPRSPKGPSRRARIVLTSILGVCVLCIAVALLGAIVGKDKPGKPVDLTTADQRADAEVICQSFVRKQLKAPSTAKFPAAQGVVKDGATYTVTAGVDSQNAFSAMIRTPYTCVVHADGNDKWSLVDLKI